MGISWLKRLINNLRKTFKTMTICIAELKNIYKDKRTTEDLESLVEYLLSCGVKPTEITGDRVSKIFGYKSGSGSDTLTKQYEGLVNLVTKKIHSYKPRVSFDTAVSKFLVGYSPSNIDRVYGLIKKYPGIPLKEIAEKLDLSKEGVRHSGERLSDLGLIVPVRGYDKATKHSLLRYFLTEYSKIISSDDLKILKSIRGKTTFEYLIALYLFDELSTTDMSKSFEKTTNEIYACFSRLVERGTIEKIGGLGLKIYRLYKFTYDVISHLISFLQKVDEKSTEEFTTSIRYKVMGHKLSEKRIIVNDGFLKKIVFEAKGTGSMRNLSLKLKIPLSTLKGYLYTRNSMPFEVMDRLFISQSRIGWKEVEDNIEVQTYSPPINTRVKNAISILRKHGLSEVLEEVEDKRLIGERWKVIDEELRRLPTFKKLEEMKSASLKDISGSFKRNSEKPSLMRMLHELEVLTEVGLVEKRINKYQVAQKEYD
jgi:hypothetical protein